MEEEEKKEKKKKPIFRYIILLFLLFFSTMFLTFGMAVGIIGYSDINPGYNTITTGKIAMTYKEETNGISIVNAIPVSDEAGMKLENNYTESGAYQGRNIFEFNVSAVIVGTASISYEIAAIKDDASTISNDDIRLYLEMNSNSGGDIVVMEPKSFTPESTDSLVGTPKGAMILSSGVLTASESQNYTLRMWLGEGFEQNENSDLSFSVKINVYAKEIIS